MQLLRVLRYLMNQVLSFTKVQVLKRLPTLKKPEESLIDGLMLPTGNL